jgi:hypothetical protein
MQTAVERICSRAEWFGDFSRAERSTKIDRASHDFLGLSSHFQKLGRRDRR